MRFDRFAGAPGPTEESIHIRPDHGAGVVESKKRIESDFLKLTLTHNASALSLDRTMGGTGKVSADLFGIVGILIRENACSGVDPRADSIQECVAGLGSFITAMTIFCPGFLGQNSSRICRNSKSIL